MSEARWPGVAITLWEYVPRSKGARVVVTWDHPDGRVQHIVSSESYEGMTLDDPSIQGFLAWVKDWYKGAPIRHVGKETACRMAAESAASKPKRGRPRRQRAATSAESETGGAG